MTDALFETPTEVYPPVASAGHTPAEPLAPVGGSAGTNPLRDCAGAVADAGGPAVTVRREADTVTAGLPVLEIHVIGLPAPQGSKRALRNPHSGTVQLVESASKKLRPWRQDVKHATLAAVGEQPALTGAIDVDITFLLPRPKSHYRTGRNAHLLRDNAPARPAGKPDVDKLLRSSLDAMTGIAYVDDAQIVTLTGRKHYATRHTGAVIHIYQAGA